MPRSVQVYAWSLAAVGTALLVLYAPSVPRSAILSTVGLALLAAVFERFTIALPNRVNFSMGSVFVFLAYATGGMAAAVITEAVAAFVSGFRSKRTVQKVFNFGQLLVAVWGMHLVASWLGAGAGPSSLRGGAALLAGSLVFFVLNTCFISVIFWLLSRGRLHEIFQDLMKESYVGMIGNVGLLPVLMYTFGRGGWATLIVHCASLLGFRFAVNLYLEQKRIGLDSLSQLSNLLERKMGVTESHVNQVALLARTMAELLKLPADEVDNIHAAAILHDIGEAEIDPRVVSVFHRRAIPTLADIDAYRAHPVLGEVLVSRMEGMAAVARLIRHHHEAWDGSGYPDGLSGEAIPLGARILAAAEAIAETPGDREAKLAAVAKLAGTVIDPGLAPVLTAALDKATKPAAKAVALVEETGVTMLQNRLLQTVRSSQLLKTMGVAHVLSFEHGVFLNFLGEPVEPPAPEETAQLARKSLQTQLPVRQQVVFEECVYDVYCIPANEEIVSVLLFDVTEALAVEREQTRRIFGAYRDVISVATQGKLVLMDDDECERLLAEGICQGEAILATPPDGARVRAWIAELARAHGLTEAAVLHLTVCASEGITNVFKHAGSGMVTVRLHGDLLRVIVKDTGDGIPYEILPQAILRDGYSTKRSLGKGFSVMLRFVDRLLLHTSGEGTVVVLEQRLPVPASVPPPHRPLDRSHSGGKRDVEADARTDSGSSGDQPGGGTGP